MNATITSGNFIYSGTLVECLRYILSHKNAPFTLVHNGEWIITARENSVSLHSIAKITDSGITLYKTSLSPQEFSMLFLLNTSFAFRK